MFLKRAYLKIKLGSHFNSRWLWFNHTFLLRSSINTCTHFVPCLPLFFLLKLGLCSVICNRICRKHTHRLIPDSIMIVVLFQMQKAIVLHLRWEILHSVLFCRDVDIACEGWGSTLARAHLKILIEVWVHHWEGAHDALVLKVGVRWIYIDSLGLSVLGV